MAIRLKTEQHVLVNYKNYYIGKVIRDLNSSMDTCSVSFVGFKYVASTCDPIKNLSFRGLNYSRSKDKIFLDTDINESFVTSFLVNVFEQRMRKTTGRHIVIASVFAHRPVELISFEVVINH